MVAHSEIVQPEHSTESVNHFVFKFYQEWDENIWFFGPLDLTPFLLWLWPETVVFHEKVQEPFFLNKKLLEFYAERAS